MGAGMFDAAMSAIRTRQRGGAQRAHPRWTLAAREMTADSAVCGRVIDAHRSGVDTYREAGFDELYVANMGPHFREMIDFYGEHILSQDNDGQGGDDDGD